MLDEANKDPAGRFSRNAAALDAVRDPEVRQHLLDLAVCFYSEPEPGVGQFAISSEVFDDILYALMQVQYYADW